MSDPATRSTTLTHWFTWRHVRCKIIERPRYLSDTQTLLELHVIAARDTPVPIATTGFHAHFIETAELKAAGGPVPFFTDWMNREAKTRTYQRAEFLWRQGDMIDNLALDGDREA